MKQLLLLAFTFVLMFALTTSTVAAEKTTVKIKCKEMSCQGCKDKITGSINSLEGIFKVDVNLKTKIIKVTFDDSKTSADKIIEAIANAGYDAELAVR
jgi:copper ion binding protein